MHRRPFDSARHATRAISNRIGLWNHQRLYQALEIRTPAVVPVLAT